jgi:Pro-kumamolisin, activation domain
MCLIFYSIVSLLHRDWLMATTTVKTVQELFQCQLGLFSNSVSGRSKVAAWGSYSIPDAIADLVEMVSGNGGDV